VLGLALGLVRFSIRFIVRFRYFQVQKIRRSASPHVHILPVAGFVKPIISVGYTDNRISYQCAALIPGTKFYYQSVFYFSPTKELAAFSIHTPQKTLF